MQTFAQWLSEAYKDWEKNLPAYQEMEELKKSLGQRAKQPWNLDGEERTKYWTLSRELENQKEANFWQGVFHDKFNKFSPEATVLRDQSSTFEEFLDKLVERFGHPSGWKIKSYPGYVDKEVLYSAKKEPITQEIGLGGSGRMDMLKRLAGKRHL